MAGRVRSRRRARSRLEALTGAERNSLTLGSGVACDWSPAERRAAWEAVGTELTAEYVEMLPLRRPAAWWEYQPGIPADLRMTPDRDRKAALRVLAASRVDPSDPWAAALAAYHEAEDARVCYLAAAGHLSPEELASDRLHPADRERWVPIVEAATR